MIKFKITGKVTLEGKMDLITKEAISRGLVDGARFTSPQDGGWYEISDHSGFGGQQLYRFIPGKNGDLNLLASVSATWSEYIYYDGKWANLSNFKRSWEVAPDKKPWNPNRL